MREGALGHLEYLYSNRLNLGRFRREENILWSFAPHDLSMILGLVGSEPDHVHAVGGWPLHRSIADVTTTHLGFPGGERAHVFVSWLHPFKEQKLVVVGEGGMAVFDDREPWESQAPRVPAPRRLARRAARTGRRRRAGGPAQGGRAARSGVPTLPRVVANGTTPRTDGREGLRVLRVLAAAEASLDAQRTFSARSRAHTDPRRAENSGIEEVMVHESAYVDEPSEIGGGHAHLALQPRARRQHGSAATAPSVRTS